MVQFADTREFEESIPCLQNKNKFANMELDSKLKRRNIKLDILFMLFGMGSWIGVNGMYVQLPLLVEVAPEGWALPAYLAVVIQIANIGPLIYPILRKLFPKVKEKYYIYVILLEGCLAVTLMSFLYNVTSYIGGEERSTVLLVLVFFVALVGCTSSVLFYPFMRHYNDFYLISYLIGEGLSGFLPSLLALVQGIGTTECTQKIQADGTVANVTTYTTPRFETQYYLLVIAFLLLLSLGSFVLINFNSNNFKNEMNNEKQHVDNDEPIQIEEKRLLTFKNGSLLMLMCVVCAFGNGLYPSIQSYSCLPYGNLAYHLAVTLGSVANPLACFLAMFLPKTSVMDIGLMFMGNCFITGFILATALMSPYPPLVGYVSGEILVVLSWVFAAGLVSYIKLCIATVFRSLGGRAMFYCGAVSQLGSALGSLILFLIINYTQTFKSADLCATIQS